MNLGTYGNFSFSGITNAEEKEESQSGLVKRRRDLDELAYEVLQIVIDQLPPTKEADDISEQKKTQEKINDIISNIIFEQKRHLSYADKQKVNQSVMNEVYQFGPISDLLNDDTITEIMVNGPLDIFVERKGKIIKTENEFRDDKHVMHIIDKIISPLGRRVDESSPLVDARLPDGSRVNIIIPPLAVKGPSITIRKFSKDPLTTNDLITFGALNGDIAEFLRLCVKGRINVLVSGGTGSGKTTLLNVLSSYIPEDERIVTIEDAAEVQLQQAHVVTLESRPANIEGNGKITIRDLVVNALRMRPDRIIVGEVRGGEALDMLQAMNTGHDGSLTTIHANSPRDSLSRLETMVMMSGVELPSRAIREQVASAIDLIIQVERMVDGSRKVTKISEIIGLEGEIVTLQDIFLFHQMGFDEHGNVKGKHKATGIMPNFMEKIKAHGENIPPSLFKPVGTPNMDPFRKGL
ncbi:CpaF family protein [Trichococcus pasteurii]|uniref:Type ii secretion system protein e n=1 Tax=Trichococcus pasteurii TaxID=43064 RepID=A0A1W1IF98_9LACT|nr:CpaF family protein [Trichococcus pasteurii]SFE45681.1 pilus assembly protein CpaF [Trichococcus pasteurii]SLM51676.1 type ii secretion system protein e [Trichococcus pasteurii]SSB92557.1 type ii secretion system protein e [Trichococcus pasteurii]